MKNIEKFGMRAFLLIGLGWLSSSAPPAWGDDGSTKPLYAELFSDQGSGRAREGLVIWADAYAVSVCRPFCTRYALPLDTEQAYQKYVDHGLIIINTTPQAYRLPELASKLGIRTLAYGSSKKIFYEDNRLIWHQTRMTFTQYPYVWGVWHGDELREFTVKQNPRLAGNAKGYESWGMRKERLWSVIDPEIKKTFGYGKYGVPTSEFKGDPFCWIAYFRYLNQRVLGHFLLLRKELSAVSPRTVIVAEDPIGIIHPYEWSAQAEANSADIYTHQTAPKITGYITKIMADLLQKDFWPLVHVVDHLSDNFSHRFFQVPAGTTLPVNGRMYELKAGPGTTVLAKYSSGEPAIVRKKAGKGSVVFFGFNPFGRKSRITKEWKDAFRGMVAGLGIQRDQDIWRFSFPPFESELYAKDPEGICLTGNYLRFQKDKPLYLNNHDTGGSYRLDPVPDAVPDEGLDKESGRLPDQLEIGSDAVADKDFLGILSAWKDIPFKKGDLTDRTRAYKFNRFNRNEKDMDNWRVIWKTPKRVTLTFDFKKSYPLKGVRLFYGGQHESKTGKFLNQMPAFDVEVSGAGKKWKRAARMKASPDTDGIQMAACEFPPVSGRFLRIRIDKRNPGKVLELVEAEVWADKE